MADNSDVIPSTTQVQRFATSTIPLLIQKYNSCSGTTKNLARLQGNENFYLWKKGVEYAISGTFAPTGHKLWEMQMEKQTSDTFKALSSNKASVSTQFLQMTRPRLQLKLRSATLTVKSTVICGISTISF